MKLQERLQMCMAAAMCAEISGGGMRNAKQFKAILGTVTMG